MAIVRPSPPSLVLALCAALLMLFVVRVKGFSNGAPEESCGNMLPIHTHLGNPVMNSSCTFDCSTLEVVGYEGSNTFTYTCGRSYTLTVVANGIMVEAREASNSFNESSPYVGLFSVDESAELKTICEGNAVTQSQIQSGGTPLNFTWVAPGPGPLRSVRFWFTVVPAPAAYYAQLVGPVGEPDSSSCSCDVNEFIYRPPGSPDIMTMCRPCPANSSSATGDTLVCECSPGTGRISEASGTLDPFENCTTCPGAPMDPRLTMAIPPDVTLTWSPPASAAWPLKYRVEWPNGTVIADDLNTTSVEIRGLNHLTEYSVIIIALANSTSCIDKNVMYNFATKQNIMDPLIFDRRFALYSMCGEETTPTLQAEDLQSSSYTISDLPANTNCTVLVVMYSRHCARNLTGPLTDSVTFTTAACPGAPMDPTLTMPMPPDVTLTWSPPSAGDTSPLKYRVEWPNGTVIADSLATPSVEIRGLNHLAEYSVVITALANSTSCMDGSVMYNFTTAENIMDPLVFDRRYALYSMCDGETTQTLQAEDLQSSSYTISDLPANTQCTALVVMYSRHCARNLTGSLTDSVTFTTAACPGAPIDPTLTMVTPTDVILTWSPPAGAAWPLKYRVEWPNGTVIADSLTTPSVEIRGLNHLTEYSVVITALTNSTSCMDESVMYNFTTGQIQPEIVTPLMSIILPQGDSHTFTCAAVADPRAVLVFRFNGERITSNSSKHTLVTNNTHDSLTVFNLQGSDEGTYTCSASNRYGSVSTAAVLTVQVPPTLTQFPSAVRDVVRGETLVASCQGRANPLPVLIWFRGDQQLNNDGNQPHVTISVPLSSDNQTSSSQLMLTNFTPEDMGLYSCVAVNSLGNDTRYFQVNSVVRPYITGITSNVDGLALFHGGMLSLTEFTPRLELTCDAGGSPPPEVVWLKDGIVLQNLTDRRVITYMDGGPIGEVGNITQVILSLAELLLSDAGEYTCRTSSGNVSPIPGMTAWIFQFKVNRLNECDPNPCMNSGICVDGMQDYTCNCSSPEDTALIYYTGKNCTTVVDNRVASSLTMQPSSMTVDLGSRVTLECTATGSPTPSIQWYKDDKAITGPQAIGNVFVIPETMPGERGSYLCEAFNNFATPARSAEAVVLIQGIVQFRVEIVVEGIGTGSSSIAEALRLQTVNQPLPAAVEGNLNLTATVYSVESIGNSSNTLVVTVATDSSEPPAVLTRQLIGPLEQMLEEVADINEQISFAIVASERHDGCRELPDSTCGNVATVTWPEREIGQVASVPCPCGVSDPLIQQLRGTRRCGGTFDTGGLWEEPQCGACQFSNTRFALCQLAEIDSPAQLANVLVNVTDNSEEIASEDVSLTVGLLVTVTNSTEDLQQVDVQMDVLSVVSNVQQVSPEELIVSQEETATSTRLLELVDDILNVVEVTRDDPFEFAAPEFGVRVEDPPLDIGTEETFAPNITALFNQIMSSSSASMPMEAVPVLPPAMVTLDTTLLLSNNNGSRLRLSTSIYGRDSLFQQRQSFIRKTSRERERVGSIVLDVSLRQDGAVLNMFRSPNSNVVRPSFTKSALAINDGSNTTCQFWNFSADGGFGAWDSRNCRVLRETAEEVDCGCDHLTHFAILLDISPDPPPPEPNNLALTWVSYIGTVLSIICIIIIIITYLSEENLRKPVHGKLLINLCFALVGLYITFIISTVSTGIPVLCGVVSALMHYFFLAVFFWMAADAIHHHRKLVTVFKPDIKSYLAITMAICWVVPGFIVIFSLAPRYQNYIHMRFCRVHSYSFWIGLIIPFAIIYIMNWIMFILIIASLLCRPKVKKEVGNKGNLRKLKENFIVALGISILFGMGWAIGLLASSDLPPAVRYPAEWIFTLLTAFTGVYLFTLYVPRSLEARKLWKHWLLCQRKKPVSGSSSTSSRSKTQWGTLFSAIRSMGEMLTTRRLRQASRSTSIANSTLTRNPPSTTATDPFSFSGTAGRWVETNTSVAEPPYVDSTARGASLYVPETEIELVRRFDANRQSNKGQTCPKSDSLSQLPATMGIKTESFVETMSFHDSISLSNLNQLSPQSDNGLAGVCGECYIAENKQIQGPDVVSLDQTGF